MSDTGIEDCESSAGEVRIFMKGFASGGDGKTVGKRMRNISPVSGLEMLVEDSDMDSEGASLPDENSGEALDNAPQTFQDGSKEVKTDDKKTHSEIVEEMHEEASQLHEAYLGDPEEFEAYENIANTISAFARAVEWTHKREIAEASARAAASAVSLTNEKWIQQIGNNAKMREEFGALLAWAEHNLGLTPDLLKEGTRECCEFVVMCCKHALAAPARNCERFSDYHDAVDAWEKDEKCCGKRMDGGCQNDKLAYAMAPLCVAKWLLAPAKESDAFGDAHAEKEIEVHEKPKNCLSPDKEKAILEIADEMERFGKRHWMHEEGQNVRMFGERIKQILRA